MVTLLVYVAAVVVFAQALIGLTFLISCICEKENRAAVFAAIQFALMLIIVAVFLAAHHAGFFSTPAGIVVLIFGILLALGACIFFGRRTEPNPKALKGTGGHIRGDVGKEDEREHVFARNRSLRPESEQYISFYENHPDWKAGDDARRAKGGPLGNTGSIDRPHGEPNVAAALASLNIPLALSGKETVEPKQHPHFQNRRIEISPREATERVKGYTRKLGACLVGVTRLNPLWVYSHRGEIFHENWDDWGRPITLNHEYAVVFAEEMARDMVATGPHTPTVMDSMRNYAGGAFISTQVAGFIANLGYSASANHLRHYDAMMVPLAIDAGLGELGRFGYLITKKYGGRVRLSAVTTDLPLLPDKPVDIGVEDFCRICKKCATCCPSRSIPAEEEQSVVNGIERWKLKAETCFDYWGKVGTDCNVCMRVCPWSHADTFPHQIIKFIISRNKYARRVFNVMDDIFYGRKPKPRKAPEWAGFKA